MLAKPAVDRALALATLDELGNAGALRCACFSFAHRAARGEISHATVNPRPDATPASRGSPTRGHVPPRDQRAVLHLHGRQEDGGLVRLSGPAPTYLNAREHSQAARRAGPECYEEVTGARLDLAMITSPMTLVCKKCRQLFQKDLRIFDENDANCPHCGNPYVIPAMTPESCLVREAAQVCEMALAAALSSPLDVGNGLAMNLNFEHLVDYSELPLSMRPAESTQEARSPRR